MGKGNTYLEGIKNKIRNEDLDGAEYDLHYKHKTVSELPLFYPKKLGSRYLLKKFLTRPMSLFRLV